MQVSLLEQHGDSVYARIHCTQKEWERIDALQYSEALTKAPNKQSMPRCENCGGRLITTCVNKKCDWSPVT